MLIAKLIWILEASIVDVEIAFLHCELQEEIYISIPEGMSYDSKNVLLLTKPINRLVHNARELYKSLFLILNSKYSRAINLIRVCYKNRLKMESK
jgi:hypothetical protein